MFARSEKTQNNELPHQWLRIMVQGFCINYFWEDATSLLSIRNKSDKMNKNNQFFVLQLQQQQE
jgi:hypothetical protein